MNHRLLWKLCVTIGSGVVALFYLIDITIDYVENDMSEIAPKNKAQLIEWSKQAEAIFLQKDIDALHRFLTELQTTETTWAAVAKADVSYIAGNPTRFDDYTGYNMGRSIDWKIHLYFDYNPIMELPFSDGKTSLLIQLPRRMRPGSFWGYARMFLQVVLPLMVLVSISVILYRHIIDPLKQLQSATRAFSQGRFEVRVREQLGKRDDELAHLAETFDNMADHIGDLIVRQRQLITDLSHELRTPLTRLDIATENLIAASQTGQEIEIAKRLERIHRESRHIRKLVDDTLTLSWLENESPSLRSESLDIVDLISVLVEDAKFEYPDRQINVSLLAHAPVQNSDHRALGQAVENILRNALRYTPPGKAVAIRLIMSRDNYELTISDQGPGVPARYLETIFRPFFRVDESRPTEGTSFGLGLALARRQLSAIAANVTASNLSTGGLLMSIIIPQQ